MIQMRQKVSTLTSCAIIMVKASNALATEVHEFRLTKPVNVLVAFAHHEQELVLLFSSVWNLKDIFLGDGILEEREKDVAIPDVFGAKSVR